MSVGATWGKILHVDLTTSKIWTENPPDEIYLKLVGGRALEAYLLLRDLPVGADPLGPENLLIFAPGVFQGTNLPGAGRHSVGGKSPLTGAIGSAEAGGWWGHEFKRSGWDALVVHGQAKSPVYLWIHNDKVEIRPADHLWGRDVADVEVAIRSELKEEKLRVSQCGIAGEKLGLMANVINDYSRAAGRNGLGAVMGSKKLKAVAVRGTKNVLPTDRKSATALAKWLGDNYKTLAAWAHEKGTPGGLVGLNENSALPTRNFQDPDFPDAMSIGWETLHTSVLIGRDTCQACPIECKQVVSYDGQDYPDSPAFKTQVKGEVTLNKMYGGPEYETLGAFGSSCGVNDIVAVSKANEWTAQWGLDPISTGMTIAFVMECVDRGLLTAEMTGGYLPKWGSSKDLLEGVDMIAHRRGFGDIMALGSKRVAAVDRQRRRGVPGRGEGPGIADARAAPQGGAGRGLRRGSSRRRPHDEHPRHGLQQPGPRPGSRQHRLQGRPDAIHETQRREDEPLLPRGQLAALPGLRHLLHVLPLRLQAARRRAQRDDGPRV